MLKEKCTQGIVMAENGELGEEMNGLCFAGWDIFQITKGEAGVQEKEAWYTDSRAEFDELCLIQHV